MRTPYMKIVAVRVRAPRFEAPPEAIPFKAVAAIERRTSLVRLKSPFVGLKPFKKVNV